LGPDDFEPIVKATGVEVPPPGDGVATVTPAVPTDARFAAGTLAVSSRVETYVVVNAVPFHRTCETLEKREPLTMSSKPLLPGRAWDGEMLDINGAGL
jgi:hypothetical protein